uniref:EF-hand domain-containing protein n=1 Tax=Timema genevievae TaxID=629358 RepID=A0A7R9JW82_TIMGE|nr:unnamed protein product [Timema genevievae]
MRSVEDQRKVSKSTPFHRVNVSSRERRLDNHNEPLDEDQVAMLRRAFSMFDTGKKGGIEKEKVRTILNTLGLMIDDLELEALLEAEVKDVLKLSDESEALVDDEAVAGWDEASFVLFPRRSRADVDLKARILVTVTEKGRKGIRGGFEESCEF